MHKGLGKLRDLGKLRRRMLAGGLAIVIIAGGGLPAGAATTFIVTEPWVRVASNARSAEAFMEIRSSDGATLVGVRGDASAVVTIQRAGSGRASVPQISLPAATTVKLAPGGQRLVLANLDRPLRLGDRVNLVLTIEHADGSRQDIPALAEVRRHSPTDDHHQGHRH